MVHFVRSRYSIRSSESAHLNAIKKYNKLCGIVKITYPNSDLNHSINDIVTCADLDQLVKNHDEIVIETCSGNTQSVVGIWPPLPITAVNLPESSKKYLDSISHYIDRILEQHQGPFIQEYLLVPPSLKGMNVDPELLMHAINIKYPVSGAVRLNDIQKIIFELDEEQFVLDYSSDPLKIKHISLLSFDIDDGFNGYEVNELSLLLAKSLNENYFNSFKNNHYEGELVPENRSGFTAQLTSMYLTKTLEKQIQKFEKKLIIMREKAKIDPDYQEAVRVAETLINKLNKNKKKFNSHLDLNEFKRKCLKSINESRFVLEQHRDVFSSRFFDNLITGLLGLVTIGISLGITYAYTNQFGLGLFNRETKSAKRLNQLVKALEQPLRDLKIEEEYLHFSPNC